MNFTFENQGAKTFLVYKIKEDDKLDTLSSGMITNNKINGIAPVLFTQMNEDEYLKYNITGKVSVKQFLWGVVTRKRLLGVFTSVCRALLSAEEYMIDMNSFVIDPEYIFADVSTCEALMICLPIYNFENKAPDMRLFFKDIIFAVQFDQTEDCDYVARLINYINSAPVFSLNEFQLLLDEINREVPKGNVHVQPKPTPSAEPIHNAEPIPVNPQVNPGQLPPHANASVPPQNPGHAMPVPPPPMQNGKGKPQNMPPQPNMPQKPGNQPPVMNQGNGAPQKKISFFNLLMHYNKENVAAYKAQKNQPKAQPPINQMPNQMQPPQPPKNGKAPNQPSFAIPGAQAPPINQPNNMPPQQRPNQAPNGMNIPPQPNNLPKQTNTMPPPQMNNNAPGNMRPQMSGNMPKPANNMPLQPPPMPQAGFTPPPATNQGSQMNFGETTLLGDAMAGETTVLGADAVPTAVSKPFLIRVKNNEKIIISKESFRIGKERSYVDYFIGDNTAISRSHAYILSRNGEYFIVDTNSKNHTYVNDVMIRSNVETKLTHGAKLKLANEEFEFNMR